MSDTRDYLVIAEKGRWSDRETLAWYCTKEQAEWLAKLSRTMDAIIREQRFAPPPKPYRVSQEPVEQARLYLRYDFTEVRTIIPIGGAPLRDDLIENTLDGVSALIEDYEAHLLRAKPTLTTVVTE